MHMYLIQVMLEDQHVFVLVNKTMYLSVIIFRVLIFFFYICIPATTVHQMHYTSFGGVWCAIVHIFI